MGLELLYMKQKCKIIETMSTIIVFIVLKSYKKYYKPLSSYAGTFFLYFFVKENCYRKKQSTKSIQNKK